MQLTEQTQTSEELKEKVESLEKESALLRSQLLQVLETLESHQRTLRTLDASIARVDRVQMEMISGSVWRGLRTASDTAKRFLPFLASWNAESKLDGHGRAHLVIDEPLAMNSDLRSGTVAVRGWCLAEGGGESVRITVRGMEPIEVKPTHPRPDVRATYPKLDKTGRAGFYAEFDSMKLPNGTYSIKLELLARGRVVLKRTTSVVVDHEHGFASDYHRWIVQFERPDDELMRLKVGALARKPLISIIMPVFNTVESELSEAIESVLSQSYENWELCIADDASSKPHIRQMLEESRERDPRIKVTWRDRQGGIAAASNSAWSQASGDFLTFLDHDDTLSQHALAYVVQAINKSPQADFFYSDEDKLDSKGRRFEPFFKPEWSPDLQLSENYICHLLVLRRDLALQLGGFRTGFDGSQDYELILRATNTAQQILRIPRVLYHWRAGEQSTAAGIGNKQYAVDAAQRALEDHFKEVNPAIRVEPASIEGRWRIRYPISSDARVSIIIASGGKDQILKANIESIFEKSTYRNFEIVVIDNSRADLIRALVERFTRNSRPVRYIDHRNKPFNYSAINNRAAKECSSPILLFLNDDTSVITSDWLEAMVEQAARPEVGAVGAKLLYPEGRIQHGGVVMGLYDNCGHAFKGLDGNVGHYFDFSDVVRDVSAVTGACLMTRADVFWQVEGFDEDDFAVAFNDVDLCLKIGRQGYRVLYTPFARLYHYEAFSKTSKDLIPHPEEVNGMRLKWPEQIRQDPFYSPNLTRNEEDFRLRSAR